MEGSVVKSGKGKWEKDEFLLSLKEESKSCKLLQLVEFPSGNLGVAFRGE
jgi:hypothetical protein